MVLLVNSGAVKPATAARKAAARATTLRKTTQPTTLNTTRASTLSSKPVPLRTNSRHILTRRVLTSSQPHNPIQVLTPPAHSQCMPYSFSPSSSSSPRLQAGLSAITTNHRQLTWAVDRFRPRSYVAPTLLTIAYDDLYSRTMKRLVLAICAIPHVPHDDDKAWRASFRLLRRLLRADSFVSPSAGRFFADASTAPPASSFLVNKHTKKPFVLSSSGEHLTSDCASSEAVR